MTDVVRLLFLHVPKTAGTSLKRFLYHQVPAASALMDPPGDLAFGAYDPYRLVAGHLDYDVVRRYERRPSVLTCLRDPVDRALSAYYYQQTPRLAIEMRSIAGQLGEATAARVLDDIRRVNNYGSLYEFLRAEPETARRTMGNAQTQYLAGAAAAATYADDPDRLLAAARANLAACDGILLAERLAETMARIDPSWGRPAGGRLRADNATAGRRTTADHSSDELAMLAELTALDRVLYEDAVAHVARRPAGSLPGFADAPSRAVDFTFDRPIRARGCHVREYGAGEWFCWTDREAAFDFAAPAGGTYELRCDVKHAASADAWKSLVITFDGSPVTIVEKPDAPPGRIVARVPASSVRGMDGIVTIGFHLTSTVRPSDLDPANPDARSLGIALSRIGLVPV